MAHPLTMYATAKKFSLNEALSSIHTDLLNDSVCLSDSDTGITEKWVEFLPFLALSANTGTSVSTNH